MPKGGKKKKKRKKEKEKHTQKPVHSDDDDDQVSFDLFSSDPLPEENSSIPEGNLSLPEENSSNGIEEQSVGANNVDGFTPRFSSRFCFFSRCLLTLFSHAVEEE